MSLRASPCLLLFALLGCGNPSLDVDIKALGGEVPGVAPSEFHRSGQPCLDCHGPYKGASPEMVLAGTVFAIPSGGNTNAFPVEGVKITVTDAVGLVNGVESPPAPPKVKTTDCAGNFFFKTDELVPAFPYEARIDCPEPTDKTATRATRTMLTRISRDGSCNGCHQGAQTQGSPGWIVCEDDPAKNVYPAISHDNCPQAKP